MGSIEQIKQSFASILSKFDENNNLSKIASNGKYLQDSQIKSLDNIFRAMQHLEKSCLDNQINPLLTKLFENIVKYICSPSFIEIFIHSTTQE
ncbi:unnamed protein product, partial [Rotaria magnacalcarata]